MLKNRNRTAVAQALTAKVVTTVKTRMTALTLVGLLLSLAGGILYLTLINRTATTGFEIKSLEQRVGELRDTNKRLELQATQLRSLSVVESTTESLGLTEVANIRYLPVTGSAVAQK
jgi:cell division protein FtsL